MATQKSKRRSRKRRNPGSAPRAVASQRRVQRAERPAPAAGRAQRPPGQLGTFGERPTSPFGGLPISEFAIFAGLVCMIVWFFGRGTPVLITGLIITTLGVLEVTAREHFSGYRSHTTLLAAIPALAGGIGLLTLLGAGGNRAPLLVAVAGPVYALLFWLLRKRFMTARQARVARPPASPAP